MKLLVKAIWQGVLSGAAARERAQAKTPDSLGLHGSVLQALYWLGFEISNVVVHGARA